MAKEHDELLELLKDIPMDKKQRAMAEAGVNKLTVERAKAIADNLRKAQTEIPKLVAKMLKARLARKRPKDSDDGLE